MKEVNELPFVRTSGGQVVQLWSPRRTGTWGEDNAIGRGYAGELLQVMRRSGATTLLGQVMRSIVEGGQHEGVEVGFYQALAEQLVLDGSRTVTLEDVRRAA